MSSTYEEVSDDLIHALLTYNHVTATDMDVSDEVREDARKELVCLQAEQRQRRLERKAHPWWRHLKKIRLIFIGELPDRPARANERWGGDSQAQLPEQLDLGI